MNLCRTEKKIPIPGNLIFAKINVMKIMSSAGLNSGKCQEANYEGLQRKPEQCKGQDFEFQSLEDLGSSIDNAFS